MTRQRGEWADILKIAADLHDLLDAAIRPHLGTSTYERCLVREAAERAWLEEGSRHEP